MLNVEAITTDHSDLLDLAYLIGDMCVESVLVKSGIVVVIYIDTRKFLRKQVEMLLVVGSDGPEDLYWCIVKEETLGVVSREYTMSFHRKGGAYGT